MKIISNTGPIIGLAKIRRLDLLKKMGREVRIPSFVHRELFGKINAGTREIEKALKEFIKVSPVKGASDPILENVLVELDEGERQAIMLARSSEGNVILLMDDFAGRKAARKLKLQVIGLVGLLIVAKEKGLVDQVTLLVEELREAGYWLSDDVIRISKKLAKE